MVMDVGLIDVRTDDDLVSVEKLIAELAADLMSELGRQLTDLKALDDMLSLNVVCLSVALLRSQPFVRGGLHFTVY